MREINQKLLQELRDGKICVYYGSLAETGDLDGLKLLLNTAFEDSTGWIGGTCEYYKRLIDTRDWTGKDSQPEEPYYNLEDFFCAEEVKVHNYEIF